jgi:hypothetical protein
MTVAQANGADGGTNTATRLTATGANATILQSITDASAQRVQSVFIRRQTGVGSVQMTQDNGATWTTLTFTGAFAQKAIPNQTIANPVIGFRIVTNGDAIDVDYVQQAQGTDASSAIATTTVPFTRSADAGTVSNPLVAAQGSIGVDFTPLSTIVASARFASAQAAGVGEVYLYAPTAVKLSSNNPTDGAKDFLTAATYVVGTRTKIGMAYGGGVQNGSKGGVLGTQATYTTTTPNATIQFGADVSGANAGPAMGIYAISFNTVTPATVANV